MNRLCRIAEVVLVLLCPLLTLEALAQKTLSDHQYRLVGVKKRIFLQMEKPGVGVTDQEYGRLTQQIELRLREAGFRVMTGTSQDHVEHAKTSASQGSLATAYSTKLIPEIRMRWVQGTGGFLYSIIVAVENAVFVVGKDSNTPLVLAIPDPKDPGKAQTVCLLRGTSAFLYVHVIYGLDPTGSTIHNAALRAVDGFIDDYLTANPRT